jgi:histidine triad (HIT) family protein
MSDCLFCRIAAGSVPAEIVYQDEELVAFRDIGPQAPTHVLVIPRQHIDTLNDLTEEQAPLIGKMHLVAKQLAEQEGIAEDGYRTLINCNSAGGQAVYHIHLHLMGGRQMLWPPG